MFLNLFPFICTRCLLWRHAALYALRLAVAYGLVLRGFATWEPAQPDDLAQFRLVLTPQESRHD